MVCNNLLTCLDYNETFKIHTNASAFQLEAVIRQKVKHIPFYSRKLTDDQQRYTVAENKLLSIVETLKGIRYILFGQKLIIYTDNKNLTRIFLHRFSPIMENNT